ncbi:hypothetical protein CASFOL_040918 [Castilleja foliolosa]|uniref:Gnk2-homologous domain-containing protein n=1 Tax=Castilleja foliolosa TaxID=1961234 RepID=A0ABD3BEL3_9LAMI
MGYGFLIIIIFPLLIQTQTAADDSNPRYNCSSTSEKYAKNSTYENNLKNLLSDLNNKSLDHVFYNTSYGRNPNRVYGLALCHGNNTSSSNCHSCVKFATQYITGSCPNNKAIIYWLDFCYVKYSNVDFFGHIDTDNKLTLVMNPHKVTYSLTAITLGLLSNLSKKATADNHMFARGKAFEPRSGFDIFGLVQCSGDLSKYNCIKCLDYAMKQLPINSTNLGVKVVTGSCVVRYDSYEFR